MRIGIDARELCGRPTGVGRYLAGLLRQWALDERARRHEFILYAPEAIGIELDTRRFAARVIAGAAGTWWEQMQLPPIANADRLDVFFAPAYTAPIRLKTPVVLAIHDVSYLAHPEWFAMREGVRRRWLTRVAAERARVITTLSAFSKREILEHLSVPEAKVRIIVPGIDAPRVDSSVARLKPSRYDDVATRSAQSFSDHDVVARRLQPSGGDARVLYVGSIFNRRHIPDLIRALGVLAERRPTVSLDIVGDNRTFPREDIARDVAAQGLNDRVRWHQYVPDEQLRSLYARARTFAFLSEYEGLGLPPLEALAVNVPPVVGDTPVAHESCGDAAVYTPVDDATSIARALERALFDDDVRTGVLAAAPVTLARYSWPRAARETLAALEDAAHR